MKIKLLSIVLFLLYEECCCDKIDFLESSRNVNPEETRTRRRANYFVSADAQASCDSGWFLHENKCYRIFRNTKTTQPKAKRICRYFSGNLIVPKNKGEQAFLVRLLGTFDSLGNYWMGMQAIRRGRRFYDIDGNRISFKRWAKDRSRLATKKCSYWSKQRWYTANCTQEYKLMCTKNATITKIFKCGEIQDETIDDYMRTQADEKTRNRIINGYPAEEGQFPWQASLRFKRPIFADGIEIIHNCGATLIDECWVLSAAHCFPDSIASRFLVRLGDLNNEIDDGSEQEFEIDRLFMHEDYTIFPSPRNDIALIKLAKKRGRCAKFNIAVQPACLPTSNFPVKESGERCQVSGWGVTNTSLGQSSALANLQWVTLPTLPNSYCKSKYNKRSTLFIDDVMFCAGLKEGGEDACTGDSGGPYVCRNSKGKYALVGIVSFGVGCARSAYPGVYTNVAHYLPWISAKISGNGGGNLRVS